MPNIRVLDPSASPLDFFGSELRRLREEAGLKQGELGRVIYVTGSLIGQIETAHKVPTRQFAERVDAALGTDGMFTRLVGLVLRSQLPTWFQAYAEMEARAAYVSSYQPQLVDGLLQTEGYARAVLGVNGTNGIDAKVAARLERQRVLARGNPPLTWVILDEAVLYRPIGGCAVMREQLGRLLHCRELEWVRIQVLPFGAAQHAGLLGAFNILRFDDDPDIVYTEDLVQGHMTANPETVKEASLRYARLQASALSEEKSAVLITRAMEERYGDGPEALGHGVA